MLKKDKCLKFLICFIIPFVFSCKSNSIDNTDNRNDCYMWFVDALTLEGSWIEIDPFSTGPILANGECTYFYSGGNIREKCRLDENGDFDTLFLYNLNNEMTHYSNVSGDSLENYIVNDGDFEAFDLKGELMQSGVISNHKMESYSWHGTFEKCIQLNEFEFMAKETSDQLIKEIGDSIAEIKYKDSFLFESRSIDFLDSIRIIKLGKVNELLQKANALECSKELINLKRVTIISIEEFHNSLKVDFKKILDNLRVGWNREQRDKSHGIISAFKERSRIAVSNFSDEILKFHRSFLINEFTGYYYMKTVDEDVKEFINSGL